MKFQHTSYSCPEIIALTGESALSIDCQIEVRIGQNGHPSEIVIPDLNSLRSLQAEINQKLCELDNKLGNSDLVMSK